LAIQQEMEPYLLGYMYFVTDRNLNSKIMNILYILYFCTHVYNMSESGNI